jgi:ankyrin repeat protein
MTVAQALADVNGRNASSQTPLNRAARKGNVDVAHFLIELGAEVASRNCASRSGLLEVSRALLDHGANANARKQNHWIPIHLSARNGHLEIAKLLLERGTDVHAVNGEGQAPYRVSLAYGNGCVAGSEKGSL